MQMRKRLAGASLALLATLVAPGLVCAQTTDPPEPPEVRRPYRGLFGGPGGRAGSQSLGLSASVYGAYDDNVYADQFGFAPVPGDLRQSGFYQGATAGLNYARRGRRIGFGADAGVGVNRYPGRSVLASYRGGANLSVPIKRYTSLSLSSSVSYSPEFRLGVFVDPNQPSNFQDPFSAVTPDLGVFGEPSFHTNSGVGVSRSFRRNGSLSGHYSLTTAHYRSSELDYSSQGVGARYSRGLSRYSSLRLGYSYGIGGYSRAETEQRGIHTIDAGVDYGRALSISRRTHFSFSTGSALFYANQSIEGILDYRLQFALLGSANLVHEMGRTWTAALSYRRSVDFHEGFTEPFLAQAVSADVQGLLSRRLRFSASTSYSRGLIGARSADRFDSTSANAGLQYGLTRYLAAYVNYVYYQYGFDTVVTIDPRFPQRLQRNGVRFGLSTAIPLIRAK
jgi:opacity protein-like surface antigen